MSLHRPSSLVPSAQSVSGLSENSALVAMWERQAAMKVPFME